MADGEGIGPRLSQGQRLRHRRRRRFRHKGDCLLTFEVRISLVADALYEGQKEEEEEKLA